MVLEGEVNLEQPGKPADTLAENDYAFFPVNSKYKLLSTEAAALLVYERLLDSVTAAALGEQDVLTGNVEARPLLDTGVESGFKMHIYAFNP